MKSGLRQRLKVPKKSPGRRIVDVIVSLAGLVLLSPLFILIPIVIVTTGGGPAYYGQMRVGQNGKLFKIWKFRSMKRKAEPFGPELAYPDDPRVTGPGRLLRKMHLDEIPQLWNLLRGDMTIIGYRPERPFYVTKILKEYPDYQNLLDSKPGLISHGVIVFGYASSIDALVERAKMDTGYLKGRTACSDCKLLVKTFGNILRGKGV